MEERIKEMVVELRKLASELAAMLPNVNDDKRENEILEARRKINAAAHWLE